MENNVDLRFLHAAIEFHKYNMKVIHWKSTGPHFMSLHTTAEDIYNVLNEYSDLVAEMAIMNDIVPASFPDISTILDNSVERFQYLSTTALFDEVSAVTNISNILNQLIVITDSVKPTLTSDQVSEIETYQYKLRLEARYKCKMKLR